MSVTYDDIVSAQQEQGDVIRKTSLTFSDTFTQLTGSTVYLKNEFEQKTGSFKLRGAYYKIKTLSEEERKIGVVAASAGNHAQGVAYASALEKINCTIVMPKNASPAKVAATRGYGATVVLEGKNYDESWIKAQEIAKTTGATIIHAFDDSQIMAAQGVIGLEIIEQLPDVDEIYVPIGGGGLAAGILTAIKDKNPNVWFSLNGERLGTYNGHNGAVWCIDVDWETKNFMSGAADATCKIWDVGTGQVKHNFVCANAVRTCEFSYSGNLAMYTTDSTLKESCYLIIRDLRLPGI